MQGVQTKKHVLCRTANKRNPHESYLGQNPKEQNCCEKGSASETKTWAVKLPAQLSPWTCSSTCCPSATSPLNRKNFSQFATRLSYLDHRHSVSCGLPPCQGIPGWTKAFSQMSQSAYVQCFEEYFQLYHLVKHYCPNYLLNFEGGIALSILNMSGETGPLCGKGLPTALGWRESTGTALCPRRREECRNNSIWEPLGLLAYLPAMENHRDGRFQ